jgi:predicted 3-demethylubiquinone-9 3-methyltransferase (glyoxalase superfamily)
MIRSVDFDLVRSTSDQRRSHLMATITPFLWYDTQAEEAVNYYLSIFKQGKVLNVMRAGGRVAAVTFELDGRQFYAFNGGPQFKFTEAISMFVDCETQEEVDELWAKLTAGGSESRCGWSRDKFGLWWQVIPRALTWLMNDPNPRKAQAVVQAMLRMSKIIIADLEKAYEGEGSGV